MVTKNQERINETTLELGCKIKLGKGNPKGGGERLCQQRFLEKRGRQTPFSSPAPGACLPQTQILCGVEDGGPGMAHWLVLRLSVTMRPARAWGSNPEKSWLKKRG